MSAKTVTQSSTSFARPAMWVTAWFLAWIGARVVLESSSVPSWARVAAALAPAPIAGVALLTILRGARELDELEQRIQLEALAFAFVMALLLAWRHRANIQRLLQGKESRLGAKKV